MHQYVGSDYKKHIKFTSDHYNRVRLYENEFFEILLICWDIGQCSPIHNHAENGCVLKMVEGELLEERYASLSESDIKTPVMSSILKTGSAGYIDNNIGVHRIAALN